MADKVNNNVDNVCNVLKIQFWSNLACALCRVLVTLANHHGTRFKNQNLKVSALKSSR